MKSQKMPEIAAETKFAKPMVVKSLNRDKILLILFQLIMYVVRIIDNIKYAKIILKLPN